MRGPVSAFVAGVVFAVGLVFGGMTQPSKVVGFLDFFGDWDPSLIFVMGGAVMVHLVLYRLISKRLSPMFSERFHLPTRKDFSPALVGGSALFGIGWGLGGFCPGPGVVAAPSGSLEAVLFVGGLLGGFVIHYFATRRAAALAPAE